MCPYFSTSPASSFNSQERSFGYQQLLKQNRARTEFDQFCFDDVVKAAYAALAGQVFALLALAGILLGKPTFEKRASGKVLLTTEAFAERADFDDHS